MSSDPNTIASLLSRMNEAGLVDRAPHPSDRRALSITLTKSGHQKHADARDIAIALQNDVLEVLPAADRESFLESLDSVAQACAEAANQRSTSEAEQT